MKTVEDSKCSNKALGFLGPYLRLSLPQLQNHGAVIQKSAVTIPCGEAHYEKSAPHCKEGKRSATVSRCSALGQQYPGYVMGIAAQGVSKIKMLKDCKQDSNSNVVIETSKF